MRTQLYAVIVSSLLMSAFADAEEARQAVPLKLGLEQACMLALTNNPGIRSVREQLIQQSGTLTEARSSRYPHLTASGAYQSFDSDRLQSFGEDSSVESSRWNGAVEASVTVFSGGRNRHYVKGEEARLRAIGSTVEATEDDLLLAVHRAYYNAWLADQRVNVQKEAVSVFEEQLQITKNMFDAGVGEKYDVTQAQVALANARPPLIRAQNDRRRSIDRLQEIVGLPYPDGVDASGIALEPLPEVEGSDVELAAAITAAMKDRPELEGAAQNIETAQRNLIVVKREQAPLIDLFANYGIESDMFGGDSSLEGWSTGVRMNWSLFDGGLRRGKVRTARSMTRQAELQVSGLELSIKGEVRQAFYDQQEAAAILVTSKKVIEQARESLQLARNRYKADRGTQLEVLESQLQLTRALLEQSTAHHDMALASVQMKRAVGERIIER